MEQSIETLVEEVRALREELRTGLMQLQDDSVPQDRLLSSNETAAALGIKPQTLAVWRTRSFGPDYIFVGRHPKYTQKNISKFKIQQTVKL